MSSTLHRKAYLFIPASVLFINFWLNPLAIAPPDWIKNFNLDSESWVIGRIVQSREQGVFSYSGFLGWGLPANGDKNPADLTNLQYQAYYNNENLPNFSPYPSQPGAQGWLFAFLDRLLNWISPGARLQIFYALNCLLLSLVITAIAAWFVRKSNYAAGLGVILSCLTAQWLQVFAPKIFWSTWAFFLPMAAVMWLLPSAGFAPKKTSRLAIAVLATVLIKTLFNGFEFETAFLVTILCPLTYYAVSEHWSLSQAAKVALAVGIGACAAILTGLGILVVQFAALGGTVESGIQRIGFVLLVRTYPMPGMVESAILERMNLPTLGVIRFYLEEYFTPGISFMAFILATALCSLELLLAQRHEGRLVRNAGLNALLLSTWISLSSPLSWFIIFKQHSVIHVHIDAFVWQLPFTIFGAAIMGLAIQDVSTRLIQAISSYLKIRASKEYG